MKLYIFLLLVAYELKDSIGSIADCSSQLRQCDSTYEHEIGSYNDIYEAARNIRALGPERYCRVYYDHVDCYMNAIESPGCENAEGIDRDMYRILGDFYKERMDFPCNEGIDAYRADFHCLASGKMFEASTICETSYIQHCDWEIYMDCIDDLPYAASNCTEGAKLVVLHQANAVVNFVDSGNYRGCHPATSKKRSLLMSKLMMRK